MNIFKDAGQNARTDWAIILITSAVVAVALAIGGLYLYNAVVKGDIQGNAPQSTLPVSKFNDKALSSVEDILNHRNETSIPMHQGYGGVGDPSI